MQLSGRTLYTLIVIINSFSKKSSLYSKIETSEIEYKLKQIRNILEKNLRKFSLKNPESKQEFQSLLHWFTTNGDHRDLDLVKQVKRKLPYSSKKILRLMNIAEEEIRMRVKKSFQLLGYVNPFNEYPAPVVPIGKNKDNKLVAVYSGSFDPFLILDKDHDYIEFDDKLKHSLEDFNYSEYKLFAFSQYDIVCYLIEEEKEFYINLLKDKNLSQDNPFVRYSFAKVTEDIDVILQEIVQCIKYLYSKSPDMIPSWYDTEKERFSDLWKQKNLEFPSEEELKSLALQN